jgi:hypothetical protein
VSNLPFNSIARHRVAAIYTQPIEFGPFHFDFAIDDLKDADAWTYLGTATRREIRSFQRTLQVRPTQ